MFLLIVNSLLLILRPKNLKLSKDVGALLKTCEPQHNKYSFWFIYTPWSRIYVN